ncbi:MAG: hypothetical protein KF891_09400 [Rhizobacter sp.]|nr:hypothetical protein [Rhizobacter sp.]
MLAAPHDPARRFVTRFDPKAIAVAMLLSLALDVLGSIVLVSAFGAQVDAGMSAEQVNAAVEAVMAGTGFRLASLVYGTATTVFGGYVAARLARTTPYFNALAVGVLGVVLSLLLSDDAPWWFEALGYGLSLPAALAGGHLARRRNP